VAKIRRWFPVSHDINSDPEVWAMRKQIGEKSLSVWLEFLSIADRNAGQLPGDLDELIKSVGGNCQAKSATVKAVYEFALNRLWVHYKWPDRPVLGAYQSSSSGLLGAYQSSSSGLLGVYQATLWVSKYAEYHKTRGTISAPPSEPSEPNLTEEEGIKREEEMNAKKRTPLPDDFKATEQVFELALKNGWPDPGKEIEAFKDYHLSKGSLMADWDAAFRTWLRNAQKFSGKPKEQKEGELSERTLKILRRGL